MSGPIGGSTGAGALYNQGMTPNDCPRCGCRPVAKSGAYHVPGTTTFCVYCPKSYCRAGSWFLSEAEAVAAWNASEEPKTPDARG